jgi:hypothetical protein
MKINIRLIAFFVLFFTFCNRAISENILTEVQIQKLAAAAWKEPVRSIDVTLYKEITTPPMSENEIRKMFEDSFEKTEGPKENLSPVELEQRNRTIQSNVEGTLKEQEVGRKIKQRIRIDGFRQRIDDVLAWPKVVLLEGTPHEHIDPGVILGPNTPYEITYVNSGDNSKGDYTSFRYFHKLKSAEIKNEKKSMHERSHIINFTRLAFYFQGILGVNKGTLLEPVFVPDPNKIENLRKTGLVNEKNHLTIRPDPNNPDTRDRIEINDANNPCGTIMICDREDYSRIYYTSICMPSTGKVFYVRECNDFDSQGFPHYIKEIQYELNGDLKEKSVYRIEKVELNSVIPDEVFAFNPPEGYKVTDNRSKKP